MNSIIHFEIIVSNPERAMKFYKNVLGWKFKRMGKMDYWLVNTGGKVNGGLTKRVGLFKKHGGFSSFVSTIEVKDLDKVANKVRKAGGKWANEGGLIHGVGFHQYFKDTEGNLFGALQPNAKAKDVPQ